MEAQDNGDKMISTALDGKQDIDIGIGVLGMVERCIEIGVGMDWG